MDTNEFVFLIVFTVIDLIMVFFLVSTGKVMWQIKSIQKELERFKKNPQKANWVEKYFFFWITPVARKLTQKMVEVAGDKLVSKYYRLSGLCYFLFVGLFAFGLLAVWIGVLFV